MPKWRMTLGQVSPEITDKRILALALEHHLVSRVTSLVAVDKTPARPPGAEADARRRTAQPAGRLGL